MRGPGVALPTWTDRAPRGCSSSPPPLGHSVRFDSEDQESHRVLIFARHRSSSSMSGCRNAARLILSRRTIRTPTSSWWFLMLTMHETYLTAMGSRDGGRKRRRAAREASDRGFPHVSSSFASTHRAIPKPTVTLTRSVSSPGEIGTGAAIAADEICARIGTSGANPGSSLTQSNPSKPQPRRMRIDFGLALCIGDCGPAGLVERF
jgi:hypothetical protein